MSEDQPGDDPKSGGAAPATRTEAEEWAHLARRRYRSDEDDIVTAIVFALADAEGVDPHEVTTPVVHDLIDLDALERFVDGGGSARSQANGTVRFTVDPYVVVVRTAGTIDVYEPGDGRPASD
ncbi:hypothetical protein Hbl1158_15885 (plasmid) [Halobaculum sp. CBA1158]|uniref:HalOD1 output domain-containing protein n=1 Tax=Halobaculum sp. CBA1158 TaxID=2904243 RepID=UPI001F418AD4|nr:HalOD1 output domain-containing protein [Halobaculum sp. CBA1158]UIP01388.1 hypothetical protein Hbl1158_15885 [Halobaculum sp. CBA1158]